MIFLAISQMATGLIPRIINTRGRTALPRAFACFASPPRYPLSQMLTFGSPSVRVAKTRPVWVLMPLPASHHVIDLISVFSSGSSAGNVTGGRKLARHDSYATF
jgi:hypothetical protein